MIRRIGIAVIAVIILIGLLAYSQVRHVPNRVSGFIEADEIRVGSRLGGRVLAVRVEEGQRVKQGETLVELEPFDLLQREQEAAKSLAALEAEYQRMTAGLRPQEIAQAKARYEQFKARYDLLVAGPREQEIEAAKGRLRFAQTEQVLAQQNYDRAKQLSGNNAISQAEFDATLEKLDAARALLVVRQQELELLLEGTREEEKREASARVDEAKQVLSGFMFPRSEMPLPIYLITFGIPATYFIEILRGIVLRAADLRDLIPSIVGLTVGTVLDGQLPYPAFIEKHVRGTGSQPERLDILTGVVDTQMTGFEFRLAHGVSFRG